VKQSYWKGIFLLAVFFVAATSLGFAQGSGTNNPGCPSGATNCSQSGANANAIIYNEAGGSGKQAVSAFAGVGGNPGVFSGYVVGPGQCSVYAPQSLPNFEMATVRKAVAHSKLKKNLNKNSVIMGSLPENDDPVEIVPWNPFQVTAHDGDEVIGAITVPGKFLHDDLEPLLVGLEYAKARTFAKRVAVIWCAQTQSVATGSSFGVGASTSHTSEDNPTGVALGYSRGKTTTEQQQYGIFHIYPMNEGLATPPLPRTVPKGEGPQQQAAPQQLQQAPPAQQQAPQQLQQAPGAPSITIQKLDVIMPPWPQNLGNGTGHASGGKKVVNNYYNDDHSITVTGVGAGQPPCPTVHAFGGFFSCWPWWVWLLLALLLVAAIIILWWRGTRSIVRNAIREVPADATFHLVDARVTQATRDITTANHEDATWIVQQGRINTEELREQGRLSTAELSKRADDVIAAWKKRQAAAKK